MRQWNGTQSQVLLHFQFHLITSGLDEAIDTFINR